MMKKQGRAATAWTLAGALALGSAMFAASAQSQEMPPFGGPDSLEFAAKLWAALMEERLVGPDAVRAFPYTGAEPHGAVLVTLESTVTVEDRTAVALVKKNYTAEGVTVQSVANDPMQQHDVTVMFRRERGYDEEHHDWFWAKYSAEGDVLEGPPGFLAGRVFKGLDVGCIACHSNAPKGDMVFINDRHILSGGAGRGGLEEAM